MKLISASIAFSAIYAEHYTETIFFKLQDSVTELAALIISDSTFAAQLFNHGCWCAKIANQGPTSAGLGGNQPVDQLDQICKDWARARRCSRTDAVLSDGSSCESADITSTYEIDLSRLSPNNCVDPNPSESCLSKTCQIDFSFISAIEAWRNSNPGQFSPVTNPVCPAHTISQINNCVEFVAPTVEPTSAGISMKLQWYGDCDMDIHAWQPDGTEIWYGNVGPLASTGALDNDNYSAFKMLV